MLNKFAVLLVLFLSISTCANALELDMSVDEEIKKKYNSSKLEYEVLPNLPNVTPSTSVPKVTPTYTSSIPNITKIDKKEAIKIPSGTKFLVRSNQTISDWSKEDGTVSFTTTSPVYKKYITIPTGSKIYGKIKDSHRPQITGNGGLVEIEITSITYNGKTYEVDGKVTKANNKKIFFNNIKGKRRYWHNVNKHIDNGEKFYQKSRNVATKMSNNPILILLSPIPTVVGMAGYSVCTVLSPITAIGTKGGNISLPAGTDFELKLLDPAYVQ